jgi:DMSO/TMAO reductase YedYZ molybdopterin-dependent catalytic subunit
MKRNSILFLAVLLGCSLYAQQNDPKAVITVTGAVDKPMTLSEADLSQMDVENVVLATKTIKCAPT